MAAKKTRVTVAEDNLALRSGLRALIGSAPKFELVGESSARMTAIETLIGGRAQILLLGAPSLTESYLHALKELTRRHRSCQVLLLALNREAAYARSAMAAGARGYLLKESIHDELYPAIEAIAQDRRYLDPKLRHAVYRESDVKFR